MAAVDEVDLDAFVDRALRDVGAAISGLLVYIGDRLGLYQALAGAGPLTAGDLAARTATDERYVREWLDNQAAGGYVRYDPAVGTYELPRPFARLLAADERSGALPAAFAAVVALCSHSDACIDAFRTGRGVAWHDHDPRLFEAVQRIASSRDAHALLCDWLPALEGIDARLRAGARVAHVGCGTGAATIALARAFDSSRVVGFDVHAPWIEAARTHALAASVGERLRFDVASAKSYPADGYDLIMFVYALHDLGDPVGAAVHARRALVDDGTVMVVEPRASDRPEQNHHEVGRVYYGFSTVMSTMASRAQDVGLALGAQAGEQRVGEIFRQAGFTSFRRVARTTFDDVFRATV